MDEFDNDVADIFSDICIDRCTVIAISIHFQCSRYGLEEALFVNACKDESCIVKTLGTFGTCADADCRERMPNGGEETALFGKCAGIGNNGGSVHLEAIIIVEAKWFVLNYK